jgi:hypothetical protein
MFLVKELEIFTNVIICLCTVYLLSVYVCTFDARQHVVFINKLFEFEFEYG